jgi:hypothetical protein
MLQTRQKMKEAYAAEFAATIERAEKQIILARHGRRLLNLLDDTPVIPGDVRPLYEHTNQARQILNDAEDDLKEWTPELEDVTSSQLGNNLMPSSVSQRQQNIEGSVVGDRIVGDKTLAPGTTYTHDHIAGEHAVSGADGSRISSGTSVRTDQPYAPSSVATGTVDEYAPSETGTTQHNVVA